MFSIDSLGTDRPVIQTGSGWLTLAWVRRFPGGSGHRATSNAHPPTGGLSGVEFACLSCAHDRRIGFPRPTKYRCGACRLRTAPPGRILNGNLVNAVHGIQTRGNSLMNKTELCAHVAARAAVSRATVDCVVSTLFTTIGEALARDESVTIAGFGTFSTRARAA